MDGPRLVTPGVPRQQQATIGQMTGIWKFGCKTGKRPGEMM